MKKKLARLALLAIAASSLLSACVVVDPHHDHDHDAYREGPPRGDRDRDGVPNRYDRRPDNPYRY